MARGQLASFRTPGGHLRIPSESIGAYRDGRPHRTNPGSTGSTALQGRRENLEGLRLETEELRARRDLRKLQEEEQEVEDQRRAEAHATAVARKEERERLRAETLREADVRRQRGAESEVIHRRRQWEISWTDYALKLVPKDAPRSLELGVHQVVSEELSHLGPDQPERIIRQLVEAAVEKVQEPWKRRKEIEKVIAEAPKQLPAWAQGWPGRPSEWDTRAMIAAADAIAQLGDDAPLVKIRATAIEAANKVRGEYEDWRAREDHRRTCKHIVDSTWAIGESSEEREASLRAVREALNKLPVGCSRTELENAKDRALTPFRARAAAAEIADRYLGHVGAYIEELSDKREGEWDLGGLLERQQLADKLRKKIRPRLQHRLLRNEFDQDEFEEAVKEFVEECVNRELGLEE